MNKITSVAMIVAGVALSSLSTTTAAHAAPHCESASFAFSQCSGSYKLNGGQNDVTNGGANNLATQILNGQDVFGEADWDFGAKYDGSFTGANDEGFSVDGLGSTSGTFSFNDIDLASTDIAISLKSAKGFSLYYLEAGTVDSLADIEWSTAGTSVNKKGKAQGLSHISYYTRIADLPSEADNQIRKVPEPAAMSGLIAVGMATALRRRKQMAS